MNSPQHVIPVNGLNLILHEGVRFIDGIELLIELDGEVVRELESSWDNNLQRLPGYIRNGVQYLGLYEGLAFEVMYPWGTENALRQMDVGDGEVRPTAKVFTRRGQTLSELHLWVMPAPIGNVADIALQWQAKGLPYARWRVNIRDQN